MKLRRGTLISAPDAHACGVALGSLVAAGDLIVLDGPLGAGKTTLTQGIAEGLGVRGPITSPTFVIARVHPSLVGGPMLVHVDAYRLQGRAELDDLDLDTDLELAVTVIEWGAGLAEALGDNRLEVELRCAHFEPADGGDGNMPPEPEGNEWRSILVRPVGPRWASDDELAPLSQWLEASDD